MEDVTRFFIIIIAINLLMGILNVTWLNEPNSETIDQQAINTITENIRVDIDNEVNDDSTRPENYEGQQSFGSEERLGLILVVKILLEGLNPFPTVRTGVGAFSQDLIYIIAGIRMFIHIMSGVLLYLVIKNKKT